MVKNFTTTNEDTFSQNQELETEVIESDVTELLIKSALKSFEKEPKQNTIDAILAYSKSVNNKF